MKKKKSIMKIITVKKTYIAFFAAALAVSAFLYPLATSSLSTVSTNSSPQYKLPCIMYHLIINDVNRENDYIITPMRLEEDIKLIKDKGFTPISLKELYDFTEGRADLPEKPILLTFDDGYYNNYTYAYPLFKRYGFKGVISVIGKLSEGYSQKNAVLNNNYSYMTLEQIKEVSQAEVFEIASHTYDLHQKSPRRGILRKKGEDKTQYKDMLKNDLTKLNTLLEQNCGITPIAFTYPYGNVNKDSEKIIYEMGFKITLSCEEGINIITRDKACLKNLKRFNRTASADLNKILNYFL